MKKNFDLVDILASPWDILLELFWLACAVLIALSARRREKPIDVGLGPEPMINNIYHKRALVRAGFTAETFVCTTHVITREFDHIILPQGGLSGALFSLPRLFRHAVFRHKAVYIYFNGGPFFSTRFAWRFEPFLFRLADVKVVVMAYGGDVQDHSRDPNLLFKHAMTVDYPAFGQRRRRTAAQIDLWTKNADHVLSGCDWVDYMYHWDTLQIAHFSIDTEVMAARAAAAEPRPLAPDTPLRLFHAPNHRTVKGTGFMLRAVEELRAEGIPVEIEVLQRVPNEEVLRGILRADVVLDQLIIGWYAMTAIEAMSLGKPVVCHVRPDLHDLYVGAGLLEPDELPLVDASPRTIKEAIRSLATRDRRELVELGRRGQAYVRRRHSLETIGADFARINLRLGIHPKTA